MISPSNATPFLFRNKKPTLSSRSESFDITRPISDGIAMLNVEDKTIFRLLSANKIFLKNINTNDTHAIGKKVSEIFWGDNELENQLQEQLTKAIKQKKSHAFIWKLLKDDVIHSILCKIIPLNNKQGHIEQLTLITSDYNDSNELEVEVKKQNYFDELTGLPNRFKLFEMLEMSFNAKSLNSTTYDRELDKDTAVLFINIRKLQRINESYGYEFGDKVLKAAAHQIENNLHENAFLARFSNDKFVIFLSEDHFDNVKQEASKLAQSIHHDFSTKILLHDSDVRVSASIGIASGVANINKVEQLLQDAHLAMKKNKPLSTNQTIIFNQELKTQAVTEFRLESEFREALNANALELHYQPIINLQTGLSVGFEALARWHNSKRGTISPVEFITLAEEAGLIIQLGEWALNEACMQLQSWIDNDPFASNLFMAVNVSSTHIITGNIAAITRDALAKSGLDGKNLKLELTESTLMENSDIARNILLDLKTLGLSLAVDDFGTGYSSLSYLSRIPADTLKIDRSFVSKLDKNDDGFNIIKVIINLANSLGMTVVAEGIETKQQYKKLKKLGCHYGQGFLFSKSLPASEIPKFIKRKSFAYLSK